MSDDSSRWLAWRQILRAGNVFTAATNVIAGFLLVVGGWQPLGLLAALIAASALLYEAGMVLNDAWDADIDLVERPERPIPSGRMNRRDAIAVGWSLLAGGVLLAWLASWLSGSVGPAIVSTCLAATIIMYNGGLKATWAAPLAMGWCRLLNVLLGGSVAANLGAEVLLWVYATAIGVYTAGLTLQASAEASPAGSRARTAGENLGGVGLLLILPLLLLPAALQSRSPAAGDWIGWVCLWLLLTGLYGASLYRARRAGTPEAYRRHIAGLIAGFIVLDALISWAAASSLSGLAVLVFVLPMLVASRRAPMT